MLAGDYLTFIRELPRSFAQIGAMLPSSPALGRAMVEPIREAHKPLRILEIGPGTGPFTRQILKLMGPEDCFTVCEINSRFLSRLKSNLFENKYYRRNSSRVNFFLGPMQNLPIPADGEKYDIIVSSLPFSNFHPETVKEIVTHFNKLVAEDGVVTFLEYLGVRKLSWLFASKRAKDRLRGVDRVVKDWCDNVDCCGRVSSKVSLLNFPPAVAIRCQYSAQFKNSGLYKNSGQ